MTITEEITSTKPESMPGESVTIPRAILRAAILATDPTRGNDKGRPVLSALRLSVESGELVAGATDSYTLTEYRVETEAGDFGPVLISSEGVDTILATTKAKAYAGKEDTLTLMGDVLTLDTGDTLATISTQEGTYPDYTALIPEPGFGEASQLAGCGYNAEYLAKVAKVGKALQSKPRTAARVELITLNDGSRPSRWHLTGDLGAAMFLIMPLRKA